MLVAQMHRDLTLLTVILLCLRALQLHVYGTELSMRLLEYNSDIQALLTDVPRQFIYLLPGHCITHTEP
jgi:hypothetical protein